MARSMVTCPSCSAPISDSEIRVNRSLALCPSCDVVVKLERAEPGWIVQGFSPPQPPDGLVVEVDEPPVQGQGGYRVSAHQNGRFRATRRWWTLSTLFHTLFAAVWDSFLIVWYSIAFTQDGPPTMTIFPLVHVAVGVGLTWFVVASWLNKTVIEVRDGQLSCTHGPVPFPFGKARPVDLRDVALLEVENARPRRRTTGVQGTAAWHLMARTESGERFAVVTRLASERQAKFLRQRLEQQLG